MTRPLDPDTDPAVVARSVVLDVGSWQPWRPAELAARLAGIGLPWWVAGGWSLDLWLGRQTREHEDLEFAICRSDLPAFRDRFPGCDLYVVGMGGNRGVLLAPGEEPPAEYTQTWVWDPRAGAFRTDIFLDAGDHDTWVCKHDHTVRRPLAGAVRHDAGGVPYLRPELTLLMKAKHVRDKDTADLVAALPALPAADRDWLAAELDRMYPGHPWSGTVRAGAE